MIIAEMMTKIDRDVFDYQMLLDALSDYKKPRDKITNLLSEGAIIRIKKGLYCFGDAFRREPLIREYIANLIYGPSYVSLDYALSYHNLIPERVETVTSVTTGRSREFDTPLGTFSYRILSLQRYSLGAALDGSGRTGYLMACPEKAIIDKVWCDKRFNGIRIADFSDFLFDDLRIDDEMIERLDFGRMRRIVDAYASVKIDNLLRFLENYRRIDHA